MSLIIREISTKRELKKFVKFPNKLYSGSKYYVPAINKNELLTLSAGKNHAFEFCRAKYWVALKDGVIVGRIAGIINKKYNEEHNIRYARFGWLDFIDDKEILRLMLLEVEKWAISEGMEMIHGPLGFNSFDSSGILVEGFEEISTSFAHYNFPYYRIHIEELGYRKEVDWVEFNVKVPNSIPEKFIEGSELVKERYRLHRAVLKSKKDILKYADDLFQLLNTEYSNIYAFSELAKTQIEALKKQFIAFLNPEYISIILNPTDKVIAFGITVPSLSRALQKARGKLLPFGFIHIMKALHRNDTVDTLLIAVQKEYQGKGITGLIFSDIMNAFIRDGITNIESTRELENNSRITNLWNKFDYRQHKRVRSYIKKLQP